MAAARASHVVTIFFVKLDDFNRLRSDGIVGADAAAFTFAAVMVAAVVAGEGHSGQVVSGRWLVASGESHPIVR